MAVYKIFPEKDATLYSQYPAMNAGIDEIIEATTAEAVDGSPTVSRFLVQFPQSEILDVITPEEHARLEGGYTVPLYRHPQRTWVGLTLDEVLDMARTFGAQPWPPNSCAALGKMIEAKLKEKNT